MACTATKQQQDASEFWRVLKKGVCPQRYADRFMIQRYADRFFVFVLYNAFVVYIALRLKFLCSVFIVQTPTLAVSLLWHMPRRRTEHKWFEPSVD